MTNVFLSNVGGNDLTSGNSDINVNSVKIQNLTDGKAIKTNSQNELYSTNLDIADVTNLSTQLSTLGSKWGRGGTLIVPVNVGDTVGMDTIQSVDGISDITITNNLTVDAEINSASGSIRINGAEITDDGRIILEDDTYPVFQFTRTSSLSAGSLTTLTGLASAGSCKTTTTASNFSGFGGGLIFSTDTGNTPEITLGRLYSRCEATSDNKGCMQLWNNNAGTMRLSYHCGIDNHIWYNNAGLENMRLNMSSGLHIGTIDSTSISNYAGTGISVENSHFIGNNLTVHGNLSIDNIIENSSGVGVTIDGCTMKDNVGHFGDGTVSDFGTSCQMILHEDGGSSGILFARDDKPLRHNFYVGADNMQELYGAYYSGGGYISSSAESVFRFQKSLSEVQYSVDTSVTIGGSVSLTPIWHLSGNGIVKQPYTYTHDMSSDTCKIMCVNSIGELGYDNTVDATFGDVTSVGALRGTEIPSNDLSAVTNKIVFANTSTGELGYDTSAIFIDGSNIINHTASWGHDISADDNVRPLSINDANEIGWDNPSLKVCKTNIVPIGEDDYQIIYRLDGIKFNYKKRAFINGVKAKGWTEECFSKDHSKRTTFGWMATQMNELCSDLCTFEKGALRGIDNNKIIPLLCSAIRNQHERILELENKKSDFNKQRVSILESRLNEKEKENMKMRNDIQLLKDAVFPK